MKKLKPTSICSASLSQAEYLLKGPERLSNGDNHLEVDGYLEVDVFPLCSVPSLVVLATQAFFNFHKISRDALPQRTLQRTLNIKMVEK